MRFRFPSRSGKKADCRTCSPSDADDAALVTAARADPRAFTVLYERYLGPIYRYCFTRLGNREAAEDATSETFLKALTALPHYHHDVFVAWLFQIAHNVVIDLHRRQRPTAPLESAAEPCDSDPSPENRAIAAADAATLRAALGHLSDEQRAVIELQIAGWSHQEIAAATGKSTAAVKMLRFRALARLKTFLVPDPESASREVPDA